MMKKRNAHTREKNNAAARRRGNPYDHGKRPPASKAMTSNPKDLFGAVKVSLSKLPAIAVAHGAHAVMDGAQKYGPYNWRDKAVIASIYVDAAKRHIDDWFEGQRAAKDSEVHHLGHAIACCAIILDAEAMGTLIDDRPAGNGVLDRVYDELGAIIKRRKEAQSLNAILRQEPVAGERLSKLPSR